jgi:hypothetical protein
MKTTSTPIAHERAGRDMQSGIRRRWLRVLVVLVALGLGARLAFGLVLSRVVNGLLESRGLACSWEDLDLSMLSGRGEVRYVAFVPRAAGGESAEPLAVVDYAIFDLEIWPLLTGKLRFQRLEIDGVDVQLERLADGSWNLTEPVAADGSAPEESAHEDATSEPIDLSPPLAVEALRVQDVSVHVTDHTFAPALVRSYHLDAGISNVGHPERRTRFSVKLNGERFLDGAHLQGHADWSADRIRLDARVQLGGLHPRELAPYLVELGIEPVCDSIAGRLRARIEAHVTGAARDALRVHTEISDVSLSADGIEAVSIDAAFVDVDSLSERGASIPRVEILGVRARASLEATERLRIAGLDITMESRELPEQPWWDSFAASLRSWIGGSTSPWVALFVRDDPHAIPWSLGTFALRGGELELVDRRVDPAVALPVFVDEIDVADLVHSRVRTGPGSAIRANVRMPGLAQHVRIEGTLAPFVPTRAVDLTVTVDDIDLDALTGYLRAAGLERTGQTGGLRLRLTGEAITDACGVTDGELDVDETLTLDGEAASQLGQLRARGLHLDPELRRVRFGDIEISGTRILFARDPSRRLTSFGLRTLGLSAPTSEPAEVAVGVRAPSVTIALPRIEIGRLAWQGSQLSFVDEAHDPPRRLTVDPLGFELSNLVVGGEPNEATPPPATLIARAAAPGMFDEVVLRGTIATKPGRIDLSADLALLGTGLQGPLLEAAGITHTLERGEAAVRVQAHIRHEDGWRGSVQVSDAHLTDGGQDILRLASLRVDDIALSDDGLAIGRIAVVEPFARFERLQSSSIAGPASEPADTAAPEEHVAPSEPLPASEPMQWRVREVELERAHFAWKDWTVDPPIETALFLEASAKNLNSNGERCELAAHIRVPDTIESLDVTGSAVLGTQAASVDASITASGVRPGPAVRLLPPGIELESRDGRFAGRLQAEIAVLAEGGLRARIAATDVEWRDGSADPWFACRRASFDVPRFDAAAGVLTIGPASVEGLSLAAEHDEHGVLHAFGMRIEPVEQTVPVEASSSNAHSPAPPSLRNAGTTLSRVDLAGSVAIALERFTYRDARRGPLARALEGRVGVRIEGPCTVLDESPQATTPIAWSIDGSIAGLVDAWRIEGTARPFAEEPGLALTLAANGIRTQGIVDLVPDLAARIHGDVEDGTLEGRVDVRLDVRRSGRADSWLGQPFGAEARLEGLAFRDAPHGEVLAGVDSITVEVERVDRARGLVHVKSVDIQVPRGVARWDGAELSALGLAIDVATASPEPSATDESGEPPRPTDPSAASEDTSEVRLDRLTISGAAAQLRDATQAPEIVHTLGGLDVEIQSLTTRALRENVPMRFHAVVTGAPPKLGVPIEAATPEPEPSAPVFEELVVSGSVALRPQASGWVRMNLAGLELQPVASAAARDSVVSVENGSLDVRVDAKFKGEAGTKVQTTLVFSDLDIEEPAGGPLESTLSLPVALDAALFLLRNPAGEHRISTGFTIGRDGVSSGEIALAATAAFAQVFAVALAGAPLRLLGALVPDAENEERGPRAVKEIVFAPGSRELPPLTADALFELHKQFTSNRNLSIEVRHELGAGDVDRAEAFANPSAEECRELVARARQRRAELMRERSVTTSHARALLAVGAAEAQAASTRLRQVDRELAMLESGLDQVLEILKSNAPARARKRTRVAALEIAQARLDAVQSLLRTDIERSDLERIDVRAPRFEVVTRTDVGRVVIVLRER